MLSSKERDRIEREERRAAAEAPYREAARRKIERERESEEFWRGVKLKAVLVLGGMLVLVIAVSR